MDRRWIFGLFGLVLGAAGGAGAVLLLHARDAANTDRVSGLETPIPIVELTQEVAEALQVLERSHGQWKTEIHAKPAEWTPNERHFGGTLENRWAFDHRFLMGSGRGDDGMESISLATYDRDSKTYRAWYFDSRGIITIARGRWNADANTMTWESLTPQGHESTFTVHYLDRDTIEIKHVIKGKDGKVYLDNEGKTTRLMK